MNPMRKFSLLASGAVAALTTIGVAAADEMAVPALAPLGDPPIPLDNPMSEAKVELGKMLFFDPRLGGDASTPPA